MTRHLCEVPFCRRTTGKHPDAKQWICAEHWRLVPKRLKRLHNAALRKKSTAQIWTWRECKKTAIEIAGGIR